MFGYEKIARDKTTNNVKTKFNKSDEIILSEWMISNLVLFYKISNYPIELENELIQEYNPPLNLSKNTNSINLNFRKRLSELRKSK